MAGGYKGGYSSPSSYQFDWSKANKKVKETNPFDYIKWVLMFGVIMIVFNVAGKFKDGLLGGLGFGNNSGGGETPPPDDPGFNTTNSSANTNGLTINGTYVKGSLISIVDAIWDKTHGANWYTYEQYVNKLADLTKAELWNSIVYWNHKYKASAGNETFYNYLWSEAYGFGAVALNWDMTSVYDPALGAFEKEGWQNQ